MNKIYKKAIKPFLPMQQLLRAGGLTFFFRIGGLGLNFLITLIITRLYGEAVFGSYSLAFTIAQATGILFAMGFPNALISILALKPLTHGYSQYLLRKGLKILLPLALLPVLVYFFGAGFIASDIFGKPGLYNYIIIAAFTIPAMILHEFVLYFFLATGNSFKFNLFMFGVPNILLLLLLLIIKNVPGHYTFLFYFLSVTVSLVIELIFAFKQAAEHDQEKISSKKMIKFASPMMFSGIMLYLLNWTDVFMLGSAVSETQLGQYNLAYKLASLSMLVISSMNVVVAPRVAALYKQGDLVEMHKTVKRSTHIIIAFTVPAVLLLILLSDYLLVFFGHGFSGGRQALIIISIGFLLNAATGTVDQVLNMTGNQKTLQNLTIAGFVINVLLNLVLIPHFGINGAAMASLFTNVLFNGGCLFFIKKKLGFYTFI